MKKKQGGYVTFNAVAAFEYSGTSCWQWPHQGAKNSTTHTASLCNTKRSKFAAVKSTTSELDGYKAKVGATNKTKKAPINGKTKKQ